MRFSSSSSTSLSSTHRPQHLDSTDCTNCDGGNHKHHATAVSEIKTTTKMLLLPSTAFSTTTNSTIQQQQHHKHRQIQSLGLYRLSSRPITTMSLVMPFVTVLVVSLLLPATMISGFVATSTPAFVVPLKARRITTTSRLVPLQQPSQTVSSSSSSSRVALSISAMLVTDNHLNATLVPAASAFDDTATDTENSDLFYSYLCTLEDTYEKSQTAASTSSLELESSIVLATTATDNDNKVDTATTQDNKAPEEPVPVPSSSGGFMGLDEVAFARALLIGAAALYGTNFSLVKMLGNMDIPIGISATLRFGLAATATSPWLFMMNKKRNQLQQTATLTDDDDESSVDDKMKNMNAIEVVKELPKTGGKIQEFLTSKNLWSYELGAMLIGLEAGVWNSMAYITQAVGLTTTAASKSAFLCSLAVVIVPLLDRLVGKKLEMKQIIGVLMALGGVAVLELGGLSSEQLAFTSGDIASLVQPLAFGMAFWRMEYACHHYPDEANRLTASQLLAVFTCSALFTSISEPSSFQLESIIHWISNPTILTSLAWTGLVSTALTVYMETIALKSISAAETTLILSTEPLWGSFFAAILMGETFGFDAVIGGVLILAGCLYSSLGYNGIKNFLGQTATTSTK